MARNTLLGSSLLGPTEEKWSFSTNTAAVDPFQGVYHKMLMADFEDVKCKEPVMSIYDKRALKTMRETVHMNEGKASVQIPWKVNPSKQQSNG